MLRLKERFYFRFGINSKFKLNGWSIYDLTKNRVGLFYWSEYYFLNYLLEQKILHLKHKINYQIIDKNKYLAKYWSSIVKIDISNAIVSLLMQIHNRSISFFLYCISREQHAKLYIDYCYRWLCMKISHMSVKGLNFHVTVSLRFLLIYIFLSSEFRKICDKC